MIKFLLVINKQGHQRISKYYDSVERSERLSQQHEIIRICLKRDAEKEDFRQDFEGESRKSDALTTNTTIWQPILLPINVRLKQQLSQACNFFDYKSFKVVYRKYATLFFIIGIDEEENELAILEFVQNIVETFDQYFDKVCELDIMFNLDRVHMILDEMILNQRIVESNQTKVLAPILVMDQVVNR